jgi:hypothetical protein
MTASNKPTIYTASKTKHAEKWRGMRASGYRVISTWIDEADEVGVIDFADLWTRCLAEASISDVTLVYMEPGEVLKGALAELGAALASGRKVFAVGPVEASGTWFNHPGVTRFASWEDAMIALLLMEANHDR